MNRQSSDLARSFSVPDAILEPIAEHNKDLADERSSRRAALLGP